MTAEEAVEYIRRGCCVAPEKRAECFVCLRTDEAMRTLVREGVERGTGLLAMGLPTVEVERIASEVVS